MINTIRNENYRFRILILALGAFWLLQGLVYVFFGNINQDEGSFLYAGRLVYQGKLLYRDFAFFKPPLTPYVYGLSQVILGPGLLWGRLTSLILGILTASLAYLTAYRQGGRLAGVVAILVLMTTGLFIWLFAVTKTDPLAITLAMVSLYFLLAPSSQPRNSAIAASAMLWAAAAKITYLLSFALILGIVLYRHRAHRSQIMFILLLLLAQGLLLAGPFLAQVPFQNLFFNLVLATLGRTQRWGGSVSHSSFLNLQLSASLVTFYAYLLIVVLGIVAFYFLLRLSPGRWAVLKEPTYALPISLAVASFVPHLIPGNLYFEYFAHPLAFLSVAIGLAVARVDHLLGNSRSKAIFALIVGILLGAQFIRSLHPTARWFDLDSPDLAELQRVAALIEENVPPEKTLFTFSPYLAVEADRRLAPGVERGVFSYFPLLSDEQAKEYGVVNSHLLEELLSSEEIGAVLLTDFDSIMLARAATPPTEFFLPDIFRSRTELSLSDIYRLLPGLEGRYMLWIIVPQFGQWQDNLYIFLPQVN